MSTPDLTGDNTRKIEKLFPNVITEREDENGNIQKGVDFNKLKQELSNVLVEGGEERYRLDWPGKKESILKANTPITDRTLRPDREESEDFDNTENLYLEGDNFEILKLLQESYLNKVKMIYIDPPYNTGGNFIYKDDFKQSREDYDEETSAVDEEGNKLFKNTATNGRFHSDWLSMMYERLTIARDLLKDDGVIFISIDDNEVHNLRKICDEIFGEGNFITSFAQKARGGISNDKIVSENHNYILMYAKSYFEIHKKRNLFGIMRNKDDFKNYFRDDKDGKGLYALNPVTGPGGARKGNPYYEVLGVKNYWRYSKETMNKLINQGKIVKINGNLYQKTYKEELAGTKKGASTWLDNVGTTQEGTQEIKKLFDNTIFDFPKPTSLVRFLLNFINYQDSDITLDFFAGSATTAHAVMQQNAEDGGNRKFIMAQFPEETEENSEARKAGYKNISDIGKERIRRAAKKIQEDNKDKDLSYMDFGFRVFKTDSTNMKDVYYNPQELDQDMLSGLESNIKEDRSAEDLLTQVILDLGLELSLRIEPRDIAGNKVFFVEENSLVACFDKKINFDIVDEIAKEKPLKVVFRDASFKDDKDRINVEERFKRLSPETKINVI